METAEIPEATEEEEECNSNESGWTMYFASPCSNYSDQNYQDSEVVKENKDDVYGGSKDSVDNNNGDSDDSLASDACSGKATGNKKSSSAAKKKKLHQKEEGKNVKVGREDSLRANNKSSHGRHSRVFLQKKK